MVACVVPGARPTQALVHLYTRSEAVTNWGVVGLKGSSYVCNVPLCAEARSCSPELPLAGLPSRVGSQANCDRGEARRIPLPAIGQS